jgi:hypothetical protein
MDRRRQFLVELEELAVRLRLDRSEDILAIEVDHARAVATIVTTSRFGGALRPPGAEPPPEPLPAAPDLCDQQTCRRLGRPVGGWDHVPR